MKKRKAENPDNPRSSCLSVQELEESETYWIKAKSEKQAKQSCELIKEQLQKLDSITDSKDVIRVGGRVDLTITDIQCYCLGITGHLN